MALHTPVHYLRKRSAKKHSSKPTAATKISSRPYIQPQLSSPLFQLPAEIRAEIFSYALLAYPDPTKPFSRHTYYYRPSYTHTRRIATALLLVCRRVYLETSLLPLSLNTHIVYGGEASHAPPTYRAYLFPTNSLRTVQRDAIRKVHLFAQQYWLEDWNERDQWHDFCRSWQRQRRISTEINEDEDKGGQKNALEWENGGLEELRITIRHTDWWYYLLGSGSPLALDPRKVGRVRSRGWHSNYNNTNGDHDAESTTGDGFEEGSWGTRFIYLHGLRILELELETLESERAGLDGVVAIAASWRFPLGDGNVLVLDPTATKTQRWTGSANFKGAETPPQNHTPGTDVHTPSASNQRTSQQPLQGRRPTFIANFMGGRREGSVGSEEFRDLLEYYVVTLTWRARKREDVVSPEDEQGEENSEQSGLRNDGAARAQNQPSPPPPAPAIAGLANGPARAVGRDVIPSYWG